jgi:MATE family multidrug resistance protein
MGTTGFTAQSYGATNKTEITLILYRSISVALLLAVSLIILQYPIQWIAFKLLDGSNEVKDLAREYFYIRIFAAPATLGLYALHGWFLGMQNARIPMILAILINSLNIAFNFIFIIGFGMKSNGVAVASVIAQYSGLLVALIFVLTKYKNFLRSFNAKIIYQAEALRKFFRVNSDIFIRTILLILTLAFFTSNSAKISDDILAVNTLLFQFFFIFSYFADGFAFAGEALTGKAKGSGDEPVLRNTIKYLFSWGWGASVLFSLLFAFGLDLLLRIMTDNPELIELAKQYRWWIILLPLASGAAFIWDGIYIGVTASKGMRNAMIISSILIFLPSYYIFIGIFQNHALWLALNLFMISRGLFMWIMAKKSVYI